MTAIDRILNFYRDEAITLREKGTYFERLGLAFFRHDPVQTEENEAVWTRSDWAKENGWDGRDVGIDLVNKPAYPLELFQRVITVSLRTMEIVRSLPKLEVMQ